MSDIAARNPRRVKRKKKSGNGIESVIPDGYYTRHKAAQKVGRSIDTLKRWQESGLFKPTHQTAVGGLNVWLYTEADIEAMKTIASEQKPGRKPKPKSA